MPATADEGPWSGGGEAARIGWGGGCVQQLIRGSHSEHAASLMNRCREMSRMLSAPGTRARTPRTSLLTRCVHSCTLPPEHCVGRGTPWGWLWLELLLPGSLLGVLLSDGVSACSLLGPYPCAGTSSGPTAAPVNQLITNPDPLVPGGAHGDKRSSARS